MENIKTFPKIKFAAGVFLVDRIMIKTQAYLSQVFSVPLHQTFFYSGMSGKQQDGFIEMIEESIHDNPS